MAIPWVPVPEGARVRVRPSTLPQDPAVLGRTGTVVAASEYHTHSIGVVLDGTREVRYFTAPELEVLTEPVLPPERAAAKQRPALP